jgi:DNA-directed RNA polymerase alpha subunit
MNIKNFGKKSAEEVLDKLEEMGYSLKGNRKGGPGVMMAGGPADMAAH